MPLLAGQAFAIDARDVRHDGLLEAPVKRNLAIQARSLGTLEVRQKLVDLPCASETPAEGSASQRTGRVAAKAAPLKKAVDDPSGGLNVPDVRHTIQLCLCFRVQAVDALVGFHLMSAGRGQKLGPVSRSHSVHLRRADTEARYRAGARLNRFAVFDDGQHRVDQGLRLTHGEVIRLGRNQRQRGTSSLVEPQYVAALVGGDRPWLSGHGPNFFETLQANVFQLSNVGDRVLRTPAARLPTVCVKVSSLADAVLSAAATASLFY